MPVEALRGQRTRWIVERARTLGFDLCGVAPVEPWPELQNFPAWLARGYAGEMNYLHDPRRADPALALPGARSIVVVALNYNSPHPHSTACPSESSSSAPSAWISRYAWGDDYHDVLKSQLDALLAEMRSQFAEPFDARAYVDTGPIVERLAAKYAGLGWLAKNTLLINQQLGSWLFLGVIITTLDLAPSLAPGQSPPRDLCGTCTRCLDACPTRAFPQPYVLDSRLCISYLTIEHRGPIPEPLRPQMGSAVVGCDICQDVCPWNRKSPLTSLPAFQPRSFAESASLPTSSVSTQTPENSLLGPDLAWLASLTQEQFSRLFKGSAAKRTKWRGLVRNACVALGNSRLDPQSASYPVILELLGRLAASPEPLIAEHARWARAQIAQRSPETAIVTNQIGFFSHGAVESQPLSFILNSTTMPEANQSTNPVDRLATLTGSNWTNITAAREFTLQKRAALQKEFEGLDSGDTSIVVFGSLARDEASASSDIDWTLLVDSVADPRHVNSGHEIRHRLRQMTAKEPGREGTFGDLAFSHQILHWIGGEDDSNANTTRRILLLLESRPLGNSEAWKRVITVVLSRYLSEDRGLWNYENKRPVPLFLLNDIARYWRIMVVDFAYKQRARANKGYALRSIKLGLSRKLIYASGLLTCFSCALDLTEENWLELSKASTPQPLIEHLRTVLSMTPLENLANRLATYKNELGISKRLFDAYDKFLGLLGDDQPTKSGKPPREHLDELSLDDLKKDEVYSYAREIRHDFRNAIEELFLKPGTELYELTLRYGVF